MQILQIEWPCGRFNILMGGSIDCPIVLLITILGCIIRVCVLPTECRFTTSILGLYPNRQPNSSGLYRNFVWHCDIAKGVWIHRLVTPAIYSLLSNFKADRPTGTWKLAHLFSKQTCKHFKCLNLPINAVMLSTRPIATNGT